MKRVFSMTKAQQAPLAAAQALASPDQVASRKAQRNRGAITRKRKTTKPRVMAALSGEPKRPRQRSRRRERPTGTISSAASTMSAPRRREARVVEVHGERHGKADAKIDGDHDDDRLQRLAGLVRRRVDDVDEVRIADGDREARILGEGQ